MCIDKDGKNISSTFMIKNRDVMNLRKIYGYISIIYLYKNLSLDILQKINVDHNMYFRKRLNLCKTSFLKRWMRIYDVTNIDMLVPTIYDNNIVEIEIKYFLPKFYVSSKCNVCFKNIENGKGCQCSSYINFKSLMSYVVMYTDMIFIKSYIYYGTMGGYMKLDTYFNIDELASDIKFSLKNNISLNIINPHDCIYFAISHYHMVISNTRISLTDNKVNELVIKGTHLQIVNEARERFYKKFNGYMGRLNLSLKYES
jgi:hypothetical protein